MYGDDDYECETCDETFWDPKDRDEHMDDYDHWLEVECETCPDVFRTQRACDQHMDAKDHWRRPYECGTCTSTFRYQAECDQHMSNNGHWPECETCPKLFRSQHACIQHMNATGHWAPKYECDTCTRRFHTQTDVSQHMNAMRHWKNYCQSCDRHFSNANNFRAHMHSKTHQGQSIVCPFCDRKYTTATGLIHHLERGSCPKAKHVNRQTIWKMIRQLDPQGKITNKQIEWNGQESTRISVSSKAWNGSFWECYLCHRRFNSVLGLEQHINSPTHYQNIYHCPNVTSMCGRQFSTLAALFNHLEGESCGFMRFENVQNRVEGIFQGGRLGF